MAGAAGPVAPEAMGPGATIDHVGIAVRDTTEALRLYRDILGLLAGPTHVVAAENLKITFLSGAAGRIELMEPLPGDSAVARFLDKRGEGLHHVCVTVPDLPAALATLTGGGYQLVDAQPRRGLNGVWLAFVHPKATHGVLIELYEQPNDRGER
jgi:methylmalonyl-CoA/ethylmalonyl-CoA epimerase